MNLGDLQRLEKGFRILMLCLPQIQKQTYEYLRIIMPQIILIY